jgi:prevent-host-death family protein
MSTLCVSVPLAEAKNKLSELVDRVSRGEEFVITRHNAEIARLVPVTGPHRHDVSDAIAKMRATRKHRSATVDEIISWKNQGRR